MKKKIFSVIALAILLLAGCQSIHSINGLDDSCSPVQTTSYNENGNNELYTVVRVVDGDTIIIKYNGKDTRVRLIGINTPESVHPDESKNTENGHIASDFLKELLTGKQISIEFGAEQYDKYGRMLAYVYLDDVMVNMLLVQAGYAETMSIEPNTKYANEFKSAEKQAKENQEGFWKTAA